MCQPKKPFGLAFMYKIYSERQAGCLEASHQYTQNTWAFATQPLHAGCLAQQPTRCCLPLLCPSLSLAPLEPGRATHLFYFTLFYLRCSNPGGYLHFLLLASSMREEEK